MGLNEEKGFSFERGLNNKGACYQVDKQCPNVRV